MESNWNSSHPWLPGDKQDFPLGARATSYLPSATASALNYDCNDLPEWMENHHDLGFDTNGFFNNQGSFDADDDYTHAIRPDDMLVPLAELQQEEYTPQGLSACTVPKTTSTPKVIVKVNKFKVSNSREFCNSYADFGCQNSHSQNVHPQNLSNQNNELVELMEDLEDFDANELMNELVNSEKSANSVSEMFNQFDSSVVQGALNDLLSQLESDDANQEMIKIPLQNTEPLSPVYVPSPVPSIGNQSPQSTEHSFYQSPNSYVGNELPQQKDDSGVFASLLSPSEYGASTSSVLESNLSVPSPGDENDLSVLSPLDDNYSVSSPITSDSDDTVNNNIESELHSYSRLPNKRKSSRKGSSAPYPEGRKERKKEQNKQAALRYRQKKKTEDDKLMVQVEAEEERQKQLKKQYAGLKQELGYLKKLMREVLIANGTLSPEAFKK